MTSATTITREQAIGEYEVASREAFSSEDPAVATEAMAALGPRLLMEFAQAENDRRQTEERWLQDLRQFKGQYDPEVLARIGEQRSRAFVRKTRVKVKTANSRVEDLLFPAGNEKNWEVDTTPVPSVTREERIEVAKGLKRLLEQQQKLMAQQAQQTGQPNPAMGQMHITKEMVDQAVLKLCKDASKKMGKVIDDQMSEVRYKQLCKQVIHSGNLYGTGVLKGPLVERRVRSKFVKVNGKWTEKSESYIVPFLDYVPLWRFYPDMGADCLERCRYVYERHQMTHADLSEMAERKSFKGSLIKQYLVSHPKGEVKIKFVDNQLMLIGDRDAKQGSVDGKYEVLERWGWLSGSDLREAGITVDEARVHETFFSNVWLLPNGEVIKAVLQPINGVTWPYHIYYFDKDEASIFGEGLAAIMRDDQTMLNAGTRMMLDNAAIAAGPQLEVTTGLLSKLEKVTELFPWKVWQRTRESPGHQAVRVVDIPSHLPELSGLVDRFENNADEVSAIPRYMTGENVSSGAAGTASGMSMLMGAANIMIKDLISNWDEGVTVSFIRGMYRWNMQFNPDVTIKGDFDVKARGVASLVAREVRAQQLENFAAMTANPMDAPYIKRDKLLRQRAEANELSDVVKTEDEVIQEQNSKMAQQQMQMQQQLANLQLQLTNMDVMVKQAQVQKLQAETDRITAQKSLDAANALAKRVEAIYAALQAGGVAASNPHIAPAGDEILSSAGFDDLSPGTQIGSMMRPPVQPAGMPPLATRQPAVGAPPPVIEPMADDAQPAGSGLGMEQGMETAAV